MHMYMYVHCTLACYSRELRSDTDLWALAGVSILQAAKHHLLTENLREIWYSQTSASTLSLKSMQNWCVLHFSNGGKFIPKWTSVQPVLLAATCPFMPAQRASVQLWPCRIIIAHYVICHMRRTCIIQVSASTICSGESGADFMYPYPAQLPLP